VPARYQKRPEPPFTPGRDCAGEIYAVGQHVEEFKIGDRVVAQVFTGAFAEVVLAPVSRVFSLPDEVSYEDAAGAVTVFNTAYTTCVQRADVKPTETVLITGAAGGVGLACIQLCKQLGANVIAAVSSVATFSPRDCVHLPSEEGLSSSVLAQVPLVRSVAIISCTTA